MLQQADAALIIGDPALRIDPAMESWRGRPVCVHDLGGEWVETTGLPMVFAVWAARQDVADQGLAETFAASAEYGRLHTDEIVARESLGRDLPSELVRDYITRRIVYDLGDSERAGLSRYLAYAGEAGLIDGSCRPTFLEAGAVAGQE
jgi:predicted solute-binding protein